MRRKYNPENERIKRDYLIRMQESRGRSEATLDAIRKALDRYETHTGFKAFKTFHRQQAIAFKHALASQCNVRTGRPLSAATQYSTLAALKEFFRWLARRPGFKSRFDFDDAEYFNMTRGEAKAAKTQNEPRAPSLEQVRHVIRTMPATTPIERRNRALVAFTLATGSRDGATISLKRKHVELAAGRVVFDPREAHIKLSRSFTTTFFPVGEEAPAIVADWIGWLEREMLWGPDDPLFPSTVVAQGENHRYQAAGLSRDHWAKAEPVRDIFRSAFARAGLPYFPPHSFRKTLAKLGEQVCRTPEEFKAWSQNLGHEQVLTTFNSYGAVGRERQAEIIRSLTHTPVDPAMSPEVRLLLTQLGSALNGRRSDPGGAGAPPAASRT